MIAVYQVGNPMLEDEKHHGSDVWCIYVNSEPYCESQSILITAFQQTAILFPGIALILNQS